MAFAIAIKDSINDKSYLYLLFANTLLINFVALDRLTETYVIIIGAPPGPLYNNKLTIGIEMIARPYIIGGLVLAISKVPLRKLQNNLTRMLVEKINKM